MDFSSVIHKNTQKTYAVIFIYICIFIFIGLLVDTIRVNANSLSGALISFITFRQTPYVTLFLCLIAVGIVYYSIHSFSGILLSGNEYKQLTPQNARTQKERELLRMLDELIYVAKIDFKPKLYLMEAPYMNAFASGWNASNSIIVVTTTIAHKLSYEELKAVVAHELSHIRHGDVRLTLCVGILSNILLLLVNYGVFLFFGNSQNSGASLARGILLVMQFILPLLTMVLQMFLSRSREYMADSGAAYLMGDSAPMIHALQKISNDYQSNDYSQTDTNPTRRALYIFDPKDIFSTHPSITNRIKSLLGK